MHDFPIMLNVRGRRCVVVGGGRVASRRATSLVAAGANVTVVAPDLDASVRAIEVQCIARPYQRGDLKGAFLVVVATDNENVNDAAAQEAREEGALLNRSDDSTAGDVTVPAHARHGCLTLCVHTSGVSATAAAAIRRDLSHALDKDWVRLLDVVSPYRSRICDTIEDPSTRRQRLTDMVGNEAMRALKTGGEEALRAHCDQLCP